MHILLTDRLTCPRCGPQFGLVLLADEVADRRVLQGVLGCANCREKYPVHSGAIAFEGTPATDVLRAADTGEDAVRLAALMGVTAGPATLLLAGAAAVHAAGLAALFEDVEVVALLPALATAAPAAPLAAARVTPMTAGRTLPFASATLAGVVLDGGAAAALLEEGARATAPLGRLVLQTAPADAAERVQRAGMRILLHEADTIVAGRF